MLRERYSMTPAEYLEHAGIVGPDVIVAHCVNIPDSDLEILRRTDTTVAELPDDLCAGRGLCTLRPICRCRYPGPWLAPMATTWTW